MIGGFLRLMTQMIWFSCPKSKRCSPKMNKFNLKSRFFKDLEKSMNPSDKCFYILHFLGRFVVIFCEYMGLMSKFILLFSFYVWAWLFDGYCRILERLAEHLTLIWVNVEPLWMPWVAMPVKQEKRRRIRFQPRPSSHRGEPVTANLVIFLYCATEDAPFTAYKGMFEGLEERISQRP